MKCIEIFTLFLMFMFCNYCEGQNKTDLPTDTIEAETKESITLHGPTTSVRTIRQDRKGNIWTSGFNDKGIFAFSRYDKKSLSDKKPTITEIKQSLNLFGILEVNDGSIWFGAFDGVYRYDGNTIKDFK